MKLNSLKFALAGGIVAAAGYALATLAALIGIPGFMPVAKLLEEFYGSYGYSISWLGIIVGAVWGFAEGFVWIGAFGLVYNWLSPKDR